MIELDLQRTRGAFTLQLQARLDAPVTGLFGPSGAGKSTLLGMIAGLVRPDRGRLVVDGHCLFDAAQGIDVPMHQRRIGVVFQDSRLFPHLSVAANLRYGYRLLAAPQRRLGFERIVELLEIGHLLHHRPQHLSGGEKQRVALGRALLTSPNLLLLDEPLAALDTRLKHQILPFLGRVRDEVGIPMVYVSHAIDEVLYLTSQLAIIESGRLLAHGPFHQIMHQHQVMALAHSLGLENVVQVTMAQHHPEQGYSLAWLGPHPLVLPPLHAAVGAQVAVSIAASNVALSLAPLQGVSIQNQLAGKVSDVQVMDQRVLVTVDASVQLIAEISTKAALDMQIRPGSVVYCLVKTQNIRPLLSSVPA